MDRLHWLLLIQTLLASAGWWNAHRAWRMWQDEAQRLRGESE